MHVMMTTNAKWAIPAGANARRFLMLDIVETMDKTYFDNLWKEANTGGIEAMLHDLLRVNLTMFHPREVPATEALIEQQRRSADSITQWITDGVATGAIVRSFIPLDGGEGGFNVSLPFKQLYEEYKDWCRQSARRPESARLLGTAFKQMGLKRSRSNNPAKWTIPSAAKLQAACDKRSGIRKRP
jgi:phage/plasmid-associated DNA primase